MTKKKARKKKPGGESRILAAVEIKPGVEELLASNEAKLYLGGIRRAHAKLQAMIDRELGKQ